MPWLLLLVPTLAGVALWAVGDRHPRVLAPGAAAALGVALALSAWASVSAATASFRWGPGLDLTLAVAGFGRVMVVLVPAISLPVVVYATSSEARDPARARLIGLLVAFVGVMELLVAAGDVLTLLIGWARPRAWRARCRRRPSSRQGRETSLWAPNRKRSSLCSHHRSATRPPTVARIAHR